MVSENGKYLKIVVNDSHFVCDEIIFVMGIVSINVANATSTNMFTNSDDKKSKI